MSRERPLRGACACGRNHYIITIPPDASESANVIFDNSSEHRKATSHSLQSRHPSQTNLHPLIPPLTGRHQAHPLPVLLRVPLSWYSSFTTSYFADETHTSIRRLYSSPSYPHTRRHFCGYCGSPLSVWHERTREDAGFIEIMVGGLEGEGLRDLKEMGLIQDVEEAGYDRKNERGVEAAGRRDVEGEDLGGGREVGLRSDGVAWFENLVSGSELGRIKRRGGVERSRDGRVRVEWEIVEWNGTDGGEDGSGTGGPAKRKLEEVDRDVPMRGG
ncbi:MAG: hypothetical protein M1836_005257 [Candelina mexicana]|nr:MAG: hypothetical protein M1836_005257 [Candelina mexicana]